MQPRIPTPVPGVNVTALPIGTLEGFVLSRVDGIATVDDIAIMSGIDIAKVLPILERLADLGAVRLPWGTNAKFVSEVDGKPRKLRYEKWELEEHNVDLPMDDRKRILEAYYDTERQDHYALLGVPRSATRREIRSAYFERARHFHPDSQFGKRLGNFGRRMEVVFRRLTAAYEVLGRAKKRAEYDEYLAATQQTDETQQALEQVELAFEQLQTGQVPVGSQAPKRDLGETTTPSARPPERASPRVTDAERRERAKARLRRRFDAPSDAPRGPASPPPKAPAAKAQPPEPKAPEPPATPRPEPTPDARPEKLPGGRLRTPPRRSQTQRIDEHLVSARHAEKAGDLLAAANELQLAMALDPGRDDLQQEYARIRDEVSQSLADNYEKQARYEEKTGRWDAAGESWARVSNARPRDAAAARAAAESMLKARADLHRAQRYAQKAVRLEPDVVDGLILLARVYLEAGLRVKALRELEKAAKLDPANEMVENLLGEAK